MKTKTFHVYLNMENPYGKPIEVELTVSSYKGVVQCASLKQIKTWEHDKEITLSEQQQTT